MMSKQYYTFFLIIPPGLENLGKKELFQKTPALSGSHLTLIDQQVGGITIETTLEVGFLLNIILKIPTRILLRLEHFKCRDFPRLFKKISKFKWSQYLNQPVCEIHASTQTSRLLNTKRIEQTVLEGIKQFFKANTPTKKMLEKKIQQPPQIFLRVVDDLVTLSIDTTGDRLNIRNYRTHIGFAPIRENIAAALVYALNLPPHTHMVDPMCGSGTFLFEAATFFAPSSTREFAFSLFNLDIPSPSLLLTTNHLEDSVLSYTGLDINERAIETAKHNLKNLKPTLPFQFQIQDLFTKSCLKKEGLISIITNPPYGKRIAIKENLTSYYQKILDAIYKNYRPLVCGIIIPKSVNYKNLNLRNYLISEVISFQNGGIKVNFLILHKNQTSISNT